jgi:phosphoglycerate dehydrogenase-like enzyme
MIARNTTDSIAVTSRSFSRHRVLREELLASYANVTFNEDGTTLEGAALCDFLAGHDRAIIALEKLDRATIAALPGLKVISKYGVGIDNVDLEALRDHGKKLGWRGGVNKRSVSELALSFMISLMHQVPFAGSEVKAGKWYQVLGRQLTGKTIGIIGCGHVGKDLVGLLKPFEMRVLAHDIVDYAHFYTAHGVEAVAMDTLLAQSDIVTLHLPNHDSTRNILNAERVTAMKLGAVLINTARGGLVDEVAVKAALKSGRLAGIAFDVFAQEPPQDAELIGMPNVLATPHIGGSAEEAVLAMGRAAIVGLEENAVPSP